MTDVEWCITVQIVKRNSEFVAKKNCVLSVTQNAITVRDNIVHSVYTNAQIVMIFAAVSALNPKPTAS